MLLRIKYITPLIYLIISAAIISQSSNGAIISQSDDNNPLWSPLTLLSENSVNDSVLPQMLVEDNGDIHVVWHDHAIYNFRYAGNAIYYSKYTVTSNSWSTPEIITSDTTGYPSYPSIVFNNNQTILHVVWQEAGNTLSSGEDEDVFLKSLNIQTQMWSDVQLISSESNLRSEVPEIVVDSNDNLHIIWSDYSFGDTGSDADIVYKYYIKSQSKWSDPIIVSTTSTRWAAYPQVAIDSQDYIHVVWYESGIPNYGGDFDIAYTYFLTEYREAGETFVLSDTSEIGIDQDDAPESFSPKIEVDSQDNLHVTWFDERYTFSDETTDDVVIYRKFTHETQTWGSFTFLSTITGEALTGHIMTVDNMDNIHVVWGHLGEITDTQSPERRNVVYRVFYAEKGYWSQYHWVTDTDRTAYASDIYVDTIGQVHFMITESAPNFLNSGNDTDVFHRKLYYRPDTPVIQPIAPSTSLTSEVNIYWEDSGYSRDYLVYRSQSPIYEISTLEPIANQSEKYFTETLEDPGRYYYAVTGRNENGIGELSNWVYVDILDPEAIGTIISEISEEGGLSYPTLILPSMIVLYTYVSRVRNRRND